MSMIKIDQVNKLNYDSYTQSKVTDSVYHTGKENNNPMEADT